MGNEDDKKFTVWRFTDKPLRLSWVDHLEELYTGSPDGVLDFCGQLGPPSKLKSETSLHRDFCVFRILLVVRRTCNEGRREAREANNPRYCAVLENGARHK
ncbi:uncharacterized protein LOC100908801 [Galendromus occidentalis]|uniref:Uncharacterized protein LOC100908801 n=1 Tax=Galendromus occidentalis TaxID=34638 RepID=A0AAJ6QVK6_9ACAR|nr:uncharacterized protein LOC100908801 [Galendromus occidentalis]